jgi:hypothetical protein
MPGFLSVSFPGIGQLEIPFGRNLRGCRRRNPENPGGLVTVCTGSDHPIPDIQRTLLEWENHKQLQGQSNRRLYEISSLVDPAKAKLTGFLGRSRIDETVVVTVGFAPAESNCL